MVIGGGREEVMIVIVLVVVGDDGVCDGDVVVGEVVNGDCC